MSRHKIEIAVLVPVIVLLILIDSAFYWDLISFFHLVGSIEYWIVDDISRNPSYYMEYGFAGLTLGVCVELWRYSFSRLDHNAQGSTQWNSSKASAGPNHQSSGTSAASTWWEILGVAPDASADDIRAAYKKAAKATHPDLGGSSEAFIKVTKAYEAARAARGMS